MAFVYSCCFSFSLRLGGILIGSFSLLQGLLLLAALCVAHNRVVDLQDAIEHLVNNMNLIYTKDYLEAIQADPVKYITLCICITCIYIFFCVLYIYGAYMCNNLLMYGFICGEFLRLLLLTSIIILWLLVLKQNTMDIGLLIGASVGSGFFLLGMFYLWVCAANLPILINEIERDEQIATIARLRQLIQENSKPVGRTVSYPGDADPYRDVFIVPRRRNEMFAGSRIVGPYYR